MFSAVLACNRMEETHTAVNIEMFLDQTITRFQLNGKVVSITTDNGANIVRAVHNTAIAHVPCFAHTLNLAVMDVINKDFQEIKDLRTRVSKIITLTKKSTVARETLAECQRRANRPVKALIQECITRWNSTYLMLERFLEEKEMIREFAEKFGVGHSIGSLSDEEWTMLEVTLELLKPCFEFTVEMSSEKSVTASKVLPMVKLLTGFYSRVFEEEARRHEAWSGPTFRYNLVKLLNRSMQVRLKPFLSIKMLQMACLVDPRFKKNGFKTDSSAESAAALLKTEGLALTRSQRQETTEIPVPASTTDTSSLWAQLDTPQEQVGALHHLAGVHSEFRAWIADPRVPKAIDPLAWWKQNKSRYPTIAKLAEKYLVVQGTSVPSERLFSTAGQILNSLRTRLTDDNTEMLIFLNANLKPNK